MTQLFRKYTKETLLIQVKHGNIWVVYCKNYKKLGSKWYAKQGIAVEITKGNGKIKAKLMI